MRSRLGILLFPLMGYTIASAQAPSTPAPAFEVASVKRNLSGRIGGSFRVPPAGTLRFTNVPLRMLIRDAYQLDPYTEQFTLVSGPYVRIVGSSGPGPRLDVPRFDVQANPPPRTRSLLSGAR